MKIRLTHRLSFKQARLGLLAAFILGFLLGMLQVIIDYRSEDAAVDRDMHTRLQVMLGPASRIAYNLDRELAQELVQGLLQATPIIRASILDETGQALAHAQRPLDANPWRVVSDALFGERRSYSQALAVSRIPNEILGQLVIEADTWPHGSAFLRRAGMAMLSGFVLALVLSLVLMVLFYNMLTKPVVDLINALLQLRPEVDRSPLSCPSGHERDEIGALVDVMNRQLQNIDVNLRQKLRAEQRLHQYLEELEIIIEARTAELQDTNAQLRHSNEELQDSRTAALEMAEARAAFLANMSHEIRTPINGLLGMIGLTLDSPLAEEQRQQLTIAYNSGKVLVELLNDILDLSKFESGKLQLEQAPFDLGVLLEETASLLSQTTGKQDIELSCRIDPALPSVVVGDPTRIRQIIGNLLSNALKFTERGHIALRLELLPDQQEQHMISISIRDTGIGIAPEALEDIFSPFTQANAQISRRFGGTGLGLALCKSLSEAMHGSLQVHSQLDEGSVFSLILPIGKFTGPIPAPLRLTGSVAIWNQAGHQQGSILRELLSHWGMHCQVVDYHNGLAAKPVIDADIWLLDSSALAERLRDQRPELPRLLLCPYSQLLDARHAWKLGVRQQVAKPPVRMRLFQAISTLLEDDSVAPPKKPLQTGRHTQRILLVEDNQVNQLVASGMLRRLGYEVDVAEHGQAALTRLEKTNYGLILMDCNMPVLDGYETSRLLRRDSRWAAIPIIAVTANVLADDRERCTNAGMNDYLAKPFKRDELEKLLEKWLRA